LYYKKIVKIILRKTLKYSLKGQYFRDIPYDGEIADMYYLLLEIRETNFEKKFAAYMLKWIKEEKIDITSEQKTVFYLFRRKTVTIHLLDRYKRIGTQIEGALFGLIEYAVDSENKLTNKDFKKWLKKHRSKITSLESDMKEYSEDILLKKGYIKRQGKPGFLKHKKLNTDTKQAKEFEKNVYKFYHYLNDFSLLEEQESMNVQI